MINIVIEKSKQCGEEYSVFLSFPYDQKIVDIIRELPTRYWDKDSKRWEVPVNKLSTIINQLPNEEFDITGKFISTEKPVAEVPDGFLFKTNPFQHQIDGFNYGLTHDRWLLADEQGLGKTKQVIDIAIAKRLQKGYKHCLIICGVNGLKWNWRNEIRTHSNEEGYILGQRERAGKIVVGGTADKLADLNALEGSYPYFLITNVESIRDEKIAAKIADLCKQKIIGIVAIDEIHKCKNPTSQQGKGILKIQPEVRIAMTGTPLMNQPMDLFIVLKWLGYEKHAFYAFKNHYCVMGGYGGYEIVGYRYLEELQERLDSCMLRRLKDEVLDLPEKTYIDEYVDMTPKQAIIYKEVSSEIKANIDNIKMANNPLAELIRMRQATGYTGILSSTIKESAKLDRMEELVEEAVENGQKVVIFSNWTQMTDAICERFNDVRKYNFDYALITGQTNDSDRQAIVNRFQNDENCKVIIGTIGAMGTGLTLTAGSVEIFVDMPWNRALYDQAVDRCHRVGQQKNITIYNIMCQNTIDERINDIVQKKGKMSDALIDGKAGNMRASELLNFLLS